MEEKSLEVVNKLIGDDDVAIRSESAKYIKEFYLDKEITSSMKISGESENQTHIRLFVDFVKTIQLADTTEYLIDSLWDPELWPSPLEKKKKKKNKENEEENYLKDWKGMTNLLKNEVEISAEELVILAKICAVSVKRGAGVDLFPLHRSEKTAKEKPVCYLLNYFIYYLLFIYLSSFYFIYLCINLLLFYLLIILFIYFEIILLIISIIYLFYYKI